MDSHGKEVTSHHKPLEIHNDRDLHLLLVAEHRERRAAQRTAGDQVQLPAKKVTDTQSQRPRSRQEQMEHEMFKSVSTIDCGEEQWDESTSAAQPFSNLSHATSTLPSYQQVSDTHRPPYYISEVETFRDQYESMRMKHAAEMTHTENLQLELNEAQQHISGLTAIVQNEQRANAPGRTVLFSHQAELLQLKAAMRAPDLAFSRRTAEQNTLLRMANETLLENDIKMTQAKEHAEWKLREMKKGQAWRDWVVKRETAQKHAALKTEIADLRAKLAAKNDSIRNAFAG